MRLVSSQRSPRCVLSEPVPSAVGRTQDTAWASRTQSTGNRTYRTKADRRSGMRIRRQHNSTPALPRSGPDLSSRRQVLHGRGPRMIGRDDESHNGRGWSLSRFDQPGR